MRSKLSEETIKKLPVPDGGNRITYFAGAVLQGVTAPRGFGVRVTAGGSRAYVLNYRLRGREHRFTIGSCDDWPAVRAVKAARALRQRVDRGENPLDDRVPEVKGKTVESVLDDFIREKARGKAAPLRSADAVESVFDRLVKPAIGDIGVGDLKKDNILSMRKRIERDAGPVAADRAVAHLRAALRWFVNDCAGGSVFDTRELPTGSLTNPKARQRTRTLSPEEIALIWPLLDGQGTFGALVKTLLLTGQRRGEVAGMSRAELGKDDIWAIPAARYKGKRPHFVPLSKAALALIQAQPKRDGCAFVFPSTAGKPLSGFGNPKAKLDEAVLGAAKKRGVEPPPNWTIHDLRRTARTLMSAAGVPSEIAERVLGHAVGDIEATYNRHRYEDEKRDALEKLAARIESIVTPPPANVVPMRRAGEGL